MDTEKSSTALAAPYKKQVGRVTFQVSSFGNPKAAQTSAQMLLGLMEGRFMQRSHLSQEGTEHEGF